MVSPLAATRYHRPHPYEDRTSEDCTLRFSLTSDYNSSNYSNEYHTGLKSKGRDAHDNYSQFGYSTNSCRSRNGNNGENNQPDRSLESVPIANNYFRSLVVSTFEKRHSPSRYTEYENWSGNNIDQDNNLFSERSKWLDRRLNRADSSQGNNKVTQQASNACTENRNETESNQGRSNLRQSQFNDHDKGYTYDSHYGYVRKVDSPERVSEKDSAKTTFLKRPCILSCLICSEEVKRRDIHRHLLFGFVQCQSCPWKAKNCKEFRERHKKQYQCSHSKLQWEFSVFGQVCDKTKSKNKESLKNYLTSTIALKYYAPYDFAYNHFQTIVDEMPDEDCQEIPALIDSDLIQNIFHEPASDAGIASEVDINGNVTVSNNNSEESTNTSLHNLEEFVTFNQSPQPHVLQDETASEEINVDLVTWKRNVCDSVSQKRANKNSFVSSSSSSVPKNNKKGSKIVLVKDKHQTLIIGAPSDDMKETKSSAETSKKEEEKKCYSKDRDILPSFVSDNYVLTYTLSDDCPQCYTTLNPLEFTVCLKSHIIVAKCEECSLFICIRSKLIDSYKSLLKR